MKKKIKKNKFVGKYKKIVKEEKKMAKEKTIESKEIVTPAVEDNAVKSVINSGHINISDTATKE